MFKKLKNKLAKWLIGFDPEAFKKHYQDAQIRSIDGLDENYLFDFSKTGQANITEWERLLPSECLIVQIANNRLR